MSTRKVRRRWLERLSHRLARAAEAGCTFVTTDDWWCGRAVLRFPNGTTARYYISGRGPGGMAVRAPGGWVLMYDEEAR